MPVWPVLTPILSYQDTSKKWLTVRDTRVSDRASVSQCDRQDHHCCHRIWYATYCLAGLSIISIGLIYYSSWMWVLPKLGGYNIVQETVPLEGGAFTNTFKKVPKKEEGNARSRDDEALEPLMDG